MGDLRARGRWKIDFFAGPLSEASRSAFLWEPIERLVDERKETLDPQQYPEHLFNYIGLEHVQSMTGELIDFSPRYGKEILSRSKIFRKGDVLYGRLRPYLNKVFAADAEVTTGVCSGEFYVLVPRPDKILPLLLRLLLASDYVRQYVVNWQTGSALPRLQLHDLLELKLPLPPLPMQELYEYFIRREEAERRRLAKELALRPGLILEAIVRALESGTDPVLDVPDTNGQAELQAANTLPPRYEDSTANFLVRRLWPEN